MTANSVLRTEVRGEGIVGGIDRFEEKGVLEGVRKVALDHSSVLEERGKRKEPRRRRDGDEDQLDVGFRNGALG